MVDVLNTYWTVEYDNDIDIFYVQAQADGQQWDILHAGNREELEHVVGLHNAWQQKHVYNTYQANILLKQVNDHTRAVIDDLEGDPQAQEITRASLLTDISQLDEWGIYP